MALVAYDNSDCSDYDDEDNEISVVTTLPKINGLSTSSHNPEDKTHENIEDGIPQSNVSDADGVSLFNLLPQPSKKKSAVIEEDDEFLHKKEKVDLVKPKAKITVPSLNDFKDVDSPAPVKAKQPSMKKSGLLSLLPQPRNGFSTSSKSLVPHVLTQKNNANTKKKVEPPPAKKAKKLLNDYSDESDNDEDVQNDFFSINKPVEVPIEDVPLDVDESLGTKVPGAPQRTKLESYFKQDPIQNKVEQEPMSMEGYENTIFEAGSSYGTDVMEGEGSSSGDIAIDQEALMKLCGARSKRHREEIQMVDVNQQDLLADSREWLLKGLMDDTSKRVSSSKKKGNEPTSQQKRKHQITYLAHQAKANEAELQNQWANSRMSRRQTQNKYGF